MSTPSHCSDPTARARRSPLAALAQHQARARGLAEALPEVALWQQYHPELSPIAWHLGHCALVERYWLAETLLGEAPDEAAHAVYFPENTAKAERPAQLPDRDSLLAWTTGIHARTLTLLADPPQRLASHPLMADDYLLHFLEQHFAQHHETLRYCLAARVRALATGEALVPMSKAVLPDPTQSSAVAVAAGPRSVGSDHVRAFDNEQPSHAVTLAGARIAEHPVTNAQWLAFMGAGGYSEPAYWSGDGWHWRRANDVDRPWPWHLDAGGRYTWAGPGGWTALDETAPVSGISLYEAEAFAAWAGARLPHEHEWEAAARERLLRGSGCVWEWCANALAPYPGFKGFPYEGYSVPWFDGGHRVLRGGSRETDPGLKRPSFRNFFEPHVRHQFAGLRLAWDRR